MPLYLADTSAWNRSKVAGERWDALVERGEVAVCTPVILELLYSAQSKREYRALAYDLTGFPHLPLDGETDAAARRAQALMAERTQHRGAKPIDVLVAAIAETHGAVVLHYDHQFDAIARATGQPTEWLAPPGSLD